MIDMENDTEQRKSRWDRFYAAAITGLLSSREHPFVDTNILVDTASEIADEALEEAEAHGPGGHDRGEEQTATRP